MHWDGFGWIDDASSTARDRQADRATARGRVRDLIATAIMAVALIGLVVPIVQADASAVRLTARWSSHHRVASYQETSAKIRYVGRWGRTAYPGYYGGHARFSNARGSSATFSFKGSAVAWIGPVGPTRGKAAIYVDGTQVATVNLHARAYAARRVLFRKGFGSVGSHTLRIEVAGTPGHPTVAIDKFIVRGALKARRSDTASSGGSVRVSSIAGLLSALADNSLDEIVVANGTYHVDVAYKQAAKSLYIGSRFAGRTRAITIRAETSGRVTFDGGNAAGGMGLWFGQGAHDQTWAGFNFANIVGIPVEFGGFTPSAPAHHITMRHIKILRSCHRASASSDQEQGFYFSNAKGTGPHDILLADIDIDGSSPLSVWSGIHGYHGDAANPPPSNITIRRLNVVGTTNAIVLWYDSGTQRNWTFEDVTINGARANAIRFESVGAKTILFDNVISRGSGESGFYSSMGAHPPGVTITNSSLR